ncbi:uncharacterized protein LOC117095262 [Trachypithecus francoisi]|uniref:uncharacterized protein LOC117095262 n=1 Tax=Trachypithecus francoisi TaxID=54180 RepID=UPI00141BCE49|nr:uncharacterized protein LOC117095262 [Trachypithecus francoisi]
MRHGILRETAWCWPRFLRMEVNSESPSCRQRNNQGTVIIAMPVHVKRAQLISRKKCSPGARGTGRAATPRSVPGLMRQEQGVLSTPCSVPGMICQDPSCSNGPHIFITSLLLIFQDLDAAWCEPGFVWKEDRSEPATNQPRTIFYASRFCVQNLPVDIEADAFLLRDVCGLSWRDGKDVGPLHSWPGLGPAVQPLSGARAPVCASGLGLVALPQDVPGFMMSRLPWHGGLRNEGER